MNRWRAKSVDSNETRLNTFFDRNSIHIDLAPEFLGTDMYIERKVLVPKDVAEHVLDKLRFECQYGYFSLVNCEQLLRGLTGLSVNKSSELIADRLGLICGLLPSGFRETFGWIAPSKTSGEKQRIYRGNLRVQSEDLVLVAAIEAGYDFWNQLIAGNSAKRVNVDLNTPNEVIEIPLTIGLTRIATRDLISLEPGDVVLFGKTFLDKNGNGTIVIEDTEIGYTVDVINGKSSLRIRSIDSKV